MASETSNGLRLVDSKRESAGGVAMEKLWGVPEVCVFLGMRKTWLYEQVSASVRGGVPFRRIGGRLRFVPDEVRAWAAGKPVTAAPRPKKGKG